MNRIVAALLAIGSCFGTQDVLAKAPNDLGSPDSLKLEAKTSANGEYRVAVEVRNDQSLSGLDIPLRFARPGDSITLDRVEWSTRVDGWEAKSALIDNEAKTVIIGLISELLTARSNADLQVADGGDSKVATLVFKLSGNQRPKFEIYKTEYPFHDVMFFYNRYVNSVPYVEEFRPAFHVSASD